MYEEDFDSFEVSSIDEELTEVEVFNPEDSNFPYKLDIDLIKNRKKFGRVLYNLVSDGIKCAGSYDPDEIFFYFEEDLTHDESIICYYFLKFVHENSLGFGHGTYDEVYAQFRETILEQYAPEMLVATEDPEEQPPTVNTIIDNPVKTKPNTIKEQVDPTPKVDNNTAVKGNIIIDGVVYENLKVAAEAMNMSTSQVYNRTRDPREMYAGWVKVK
jgi:hypothetical protein